MSGLFVECQAGGKKEGERVRERGGERERKKKGERVRERGGEREITESDR